MARIRSVHPGLASDEAYMSMSMAAKAAWPLLWTESDDHGVFEWKPIVLKARIFPADNVDFEKLLDEYLKLGCIITAMMEGKQYGIIRNFCKFQRPQKPSYKFPTTGEVLSFVGCKTIESDTTTVPVPEQDDTPTVKPPLMKEEGGSRDKKVSSTKTRKRFSYTHQFEEFWKGYPQDPGFSKAEAFAEWQKLSPEDYEAAIASLPSFKTWIPKQGKDYRVVHPVRYLKHRRFDGFAKTENGAAEVKQVPVIVGTPAWDAWNARRKYPEIDLRIGNQIKRGWLFPTEFPQTISRETSEAA